MFYNESLYEEPTDIARFYLELEDGPEKYNLWNGEDRVKFAEMIKEENKVFPGKYAPEGEEVDVDSMITEW